MNRTLMPLLWATMCVVAPVAGAQSAGSRIEVGSFGQFTRPDPAIRLDNALAIGARGTIALYKWLGIEATLQAAQTRARRSPFERTYYRPFHGLATVTIPLNEERRTSLVLGSGYVMSVFDGRATPNEFEDGIAALAGLRLCTGSRWGVRVDGVMDYNPSPNEQPAKGTSTNLGVRVGMSYALRGSCTGRGTVRSIERSTSAAVPAPVPVPAPEWTLTMTPASGTTDVGKRLTFSAKAVDAANVDLGPVRWSSANAAMVTVADGVAACIAAGTTTITATKEAYGSTKTASATVTCVQPPTATVALDWTLFDFNRAVITASGRDTLRTVLDAMKRMPNLRISIEGHADRYGSKEYNARLSETRANTVRRQLLRMAGKDAASIAPRLLTASYSERCLLTTAGRDEAEPPPPNRDRISTADRKAQSENRRVEIWQLFDGQVPTPQCRTREERNARTPFNALR